MKILKWEMKMFFLCSFAYIINLLYNLKVYHLVIEKYTTSHSQTNSRQNGVNLPRF